MSSVIISMNMIILIIKDIALAGLDRDDQYLFLFARSGFTARLQEIASLQEPQRLSLVSLDELYAV